MASTSSLYEVLGIPASATKHDIKTAYRRLALTCHPDVLAMTQKGKSANEFLKIHTAYSTLSDPKKRAIHDGDLFGQQPGGYGSSGGLSTGMAGPQQRYGNSGRRNWETDQCW